MIKGHFFEDLFEDIAPPDKLGQVAPSSLGLTVDEIVHTYPPPISESSL